MRQVQSLIAQKHPDDTIALEVRRKNKTLNINVKLGEKTGELGTVSSAQPTPGKTRSPTGTSAADAKRIAELEDRVRKLEAQVELLMKVLMSRDKK